MNGYFLTLTFFLFTNCLTAQYLEAGFSIGGANYLGDLTPGGFWTSMGETDVYLGLSGRYHFNDRLRVRMGINRGAIGADDARSIRNGSSRAQRNLSFRSRITEIELAIEFSFFRYQPLQLRKRFSPYAFVGIGIFRFNPQALYAGRWHDLQPIGTEGQGLPNYPDRYDLIQPSIPVGGGLKYAITENWNLSVEYGMRKTFTDYLDDTSGYYPNLELLEAERGNLARLLSWRSPEVNPKAQQPSPGAARGDPFDLDWYLFAGFSLTYNFFRGKNSLLKKRRSERKVKCPSIEESGGN